MSKKLVQFSMLIILFNSMFILQAFAHTTVEVEQYKIEAGWGIEPPIVGIRNNVVFKITEPGTNEGTYRGVTSVFKDLDAEIRYGGITKNIEINSDPKPGYYYSPIIPTKTGSYLVDLKGEIRGVAVDIQIPLEDVESTAILDFPPKASEGSADVSALKNAISSLQQDIFKLKSGETTTTSDGGAAYDFAIFGLSIAAAAIILAIIALVKRK